MPTAWSELAFPSQKPLTSWLRELQARLSYFGRWLSNGKPRAFWLPAFLNPHALLTVALYYASITRHAPLEALALQCDLGPPPPRVRAAVRASHAAGALQPFAEHGRSDTDVGGGEAGASAGGEAGEGGALDAAADDDDDTVLYVYGLYLEGARWDASRGHLAELPPRRLYAPLPVLAMRPVQHRPSPADGAYVCPVYKTVARADVPTSSGHVIPNFVTSIELPAGPDDAQPREPSLRHASRALATRWTERGVAAFLSLPQ